MTSSVAERLSGRIHQSPKSTPQPSTQRPGPKVWTAPDAPTAPPAVSLIIPAHNEETRLAATLQAYGRALEAHAAGAFEVLVVANGCRDRTVDVARTAAAAQPRIKVIEIKQPVGKGGAVLEGFRQAQGAQIIFADADAATAPASLLGLLKELEHNDVVIGSRRARASTILRAQPWQRRWLSRIFNRSVRVLLRLPYDDTQCGAKAFRRTAAQQLAQVVVETRWVFDVDLLLQARALRLSVAEHPVVWTHRDGSQLQTGATMREVVGALWRMKRRDGRPASLEAAQGS